MRRTAAALALFIALPLCGQQSDPALATPATAAERKLAAKQLSKLDQQNHKKADKLLRKGQKLVAKGRYAEALEPLREAVTLTYAEARYGEALELARQQLTQQLMHEAAQSAERGDKIGEMAKLRMAQENDPANSYVRDRIERLAPPRRNFDAAPVDKRFEHMGVAQLREPKGAHAVHEHTDGRSFIQHVCKSFGVTAFIDPSVRSTPVSVDVDAMTWAQALDLMTQLTHSFATPLASNQLSFFTDTAESRRNNDRLSMRVFYIRQVTGATDLNDFANVMRLLFNIKFISVDVQSNAIAVRAPNATLEAIESYLDQLDEQRPEVVMEARLYQLQVTGEANVGPSLPTNFKIFNILSELRNLVGASEAQSILNEIESTGTLSESTLATLAAALASNSSSPFLSSFLLFGGGLTMTGFTAPSLSFNLAHSNAKARLLDHMQLMAAQGKSATLRVGMRYPIVNSAYSASQGNYSILVSGSSYAPSINYEDLGLTVKATPNVRGDGSTQIDLELQLRSLGSTTAENMPIITNREYKGSISAHDGEPIIIAGELDESQNAAITGAMYAPLPGLKNRDRTRTRSQMTLVLTPHVISRPHQHNIEMLPLSVTREQ